MAIKKINRFIPGIVIWTLLVLAGCNAGSVDDAKEKQKKLQELYKQLEEIRSQINQLEAELNIAGENGQNGTLVTTIPVQVKRFRHYIDIQGVAESDYNINVSSELAGNVMEIYVEEGQNVNRGTPLLKIDDVLLSKKREELNTALELAKEIYQRQENLWKQNIGSEVQYLQAKNQVESLEKQLESIETQLEKTVIYSPIDGVVDEIFIETGEMASPGYPLVRVVNLNSIKITADVSENYIGSISQGDSVIINFPVLKLDKKARITAVGQVINPKNRTFRIEIRMPNNDGLVKPNMLAKIRITDYENDSALVIPTRLIQHSNKGEYVFIVKQVNNRPVAQIANIVSGRTYNGETEVISGLSPDDQLVNAGFKDVKDGEPVKIVNEN